jgi:hypothetical protein
MKPRHLVPPATVALAATAPVAVVFPTGRRLALGAAAAYAAVVVLGVRKARPQQHDADVLTLAACFPVIHAAWGAGFLASLVEDMLGGSD